MSDSASAPDSQSAPLSSDAAPSQHPRRTKRQTAPNFRDFPAHQSPFSPRSFSTALPTESGSESAPTADVLFTSGPVGEPVVFATEPESGASDDDAYNPRHPPHLSEVVAGAFTDPQDAMIPGAPDGSSNSTTAPISPASRPGPNGPMPSNFSQTGIVHLPPLEDRSDSPFSSSAPSSGRQLSPTASRSRSAPSSSHLQQQLDAGLSGDPSRSSSNEPSSSVSRSESRVSGTSEIAMRHTTVQYQHVENEDGHHLILGREGQLTRCEDEVRLCLHV